MQANSKPAPSKPSKSSKASPQWSFSLVIAWIFALGMTMAVVAAASSQPSAQHGMAFYGTYHQNGWNQLIHFFGVPAILFSGIVFASHLTVPVQLPKVLFFPFHELSMGTVWTVFYTVYYLWIDPFGGTLFAPCLAAMYFIGVTWILRDHQLLQTGGKHWSGTGKVLKWALWVQLMSWYAQIHPGHAVLEGSKPALLDSLGASFSNAPLFAFYEGLWFFGLRTELRDQVQDLIRDYTVELCQHANATMRVCATL